MEPINHLSRYYTVNPGRLNLEGLSLFGVWNTVNIGGSGRVWVFGNK